MKRGQKTHGKQNSTMYYRKANSYEVGSVDRKGRFPSGDQIGHSYAIEKVLFRSQLFLSSSPIRTYRRKSRLFQRDARIGLLYRKSFEAHPISHHPTKDTITPYNSSDAGLTATILLLVLVLTGTRRGTPCSPPASGACRHPMAAVCVFSMIFLQHRCCCNALFGDSRPSPTPQPRR